MKKLLTLLSLLIIYSVSAQMYDPVHWTFSKEKISDNEIELQFKANIEKGWHLYSQFLPNQADAYPTNFIFVNTENYDFLGEVVEPEPIRKAC